MKHLLLTILILYSTTAVCAVPVGTFGRVIRKSAGLADNIPIHGADDIVKRTNPAALEKAAARIVKNVPFDDLVKAELRNVDPSLVRFAGELDMPSKQTLLVLDNGAKICKKNIGDIVTRGRFLKNGGADTVQAVGLYGDDVCEAAMRLDNVINAGKLVSPKGMRAVTIADYGALLTKYGDRAHTFWTKYVTPHWGKWLIGGALAWYLLDPEGFMDTAGALTEEGLKRLTQCAGDVAAAVIGGISKGLEHAAEKVGTAVTESATNGLKTMFFSWAGFAGSLVILFGIALALPLTRYYVLKPFRFLLRKPKQP